METRFKSNREIEVEAVGVAHVGYESITVNSEDMLAAAEQAIEKASPAKNYSGDFAGRITITVELLGDLLERKEGDYV